MIKLSAAIITFNEERNIERCIRSLENVADEVIVVDSLSEDRTVEIAENLGAKVYRQAFLGHIEQKNLALSYCTYDHALSLDADEALSDALRESILRVKEGFHEQGYSMNRRTNYCGKWIRHSGWYPDTKLRLVNRKMASWTGTNPHDRLALTSNGGVAHLHGDLLHYSFYTIEEHKAQIEKFSTISAQAKFDQGMRSNPLLPYIKGLAKFIKSYLMQLGILDGYYGWVICSQSAKASYLKYLKLYKIQRTQS